MMDIIGVDDERERVKSRTCCTNIMHNIPTSTIGNRARVERSFQFYETIPFEHSIFYRKAICSRICSYKKSFGLQQRARAFMRIVFVAIFCSIS